MAREQPVEFELLLDQTVKALSGGTDEVVRRDYWGMRCLYAAAQASDGTGKLLSSHRNRRLSEAVCLFGGGTSLVSAWGLSFRYSQDIDILWLMDTTARDLQTPHDRIADIAAEACMTSRRSIETSQFPAARFQQNIVRVPDADGLYLKIESSIEDHGSDLFAPRRAMSLMGRHATERQLSAFPELGGFEIPCVVPAYTAANKFDALHRRARKPDAIVARGRDLYDLACIAASEHADETRRRVRELAGRASDSDTRSVVLRPAGGYGRSDAFRHGSRANRALQAGYEQAQGTVWSGKPVPFDEAVKLAASLDLE